MLSAVKEKNLRFDFAQPVNLLGERKGLTTLKKAELVGNFHRFEKLRELSLNIRQFSEARNKCDQKPLMQRSGEQITEISMATFRPMVGE